MSDRVIVWPAGREPTLEEIEAELGRWNLADPDRAIENRTFWQYREAVGRVAGDLARWGVRFDPFDPDAPLDPDLPLTLAAWAVAMLDNGYAVGTVRYYLSAVGWWCATQFARPAADVHRHAGLVVKAWAVENPLPVRGAGPVPHAWLTAMADAMAADGSPPALRDLVLLTWNLAGALRPGEPGTVAVDDLTIRPGEIGWTFARSKGNPLGGRRDDQVVLRPLPGDVLCPMAAWERWREVWPHTGPDMPAIPSLLGGQQGLPDPAASDVLGVSEQNVNRMLARWAERAGVPAPALVTGHALRHSAATYAVLGGATEDDVRRLLRHASVATTRRYIARLSPWVGADEARRVLLGDHPDGLEALGVERRAARRPSGRVRLGRRADRLAEAADLAAAGPMAPHTRLGVEYEVRLWDTEFCPAFGVEPAAPTPTDVRLWFGWRVRRAQATAHAGKPAGVPMKAGSAKRALWCLERGLAARGVPSGTVTGEAWACWRGYARAVAAAVAQPESAAEYGLGELAALATAAGTFDPDDVARWAVGLAALALHPLDAGRGGPGGGFRPVPPSAVADPGDGTRVVTVDGFDPVVVRPGPKPPLDPVAALDHLLAVTPIAAPTILAPDTLTRAKGVLELEGSKSAARVVAVGPEVAERAMWRLAAPLIACVQDQAAVAFLTAGALRYDDLRRLRRDTSPEWRVWASGPSWASRLAGSKGNPAEGEIVLLDGGLVAGHPALDPAANLARLVAWTPWATGPAITVTAGIGSRAPAALLDSGTPPRPIPYNTLRSRLVAAADRAGLRGGLSLHSFRQSSATAAWWRNKDAGMSDADNFRALMAWLRHDDPTSTLAYITAADPGVSITADVHLDLDPLEVPDAAPGTPTLVPVTAAA